MLQSTLLGCPAMSGLDKCRFAGKTCAEAHAVHRCRLWGTECHASGLELSHAQRWASLAATANAAMR